MRIKPGNRLTNVNITFTPVQKSSTKIRIHEFIMEETGFEVGDSIDVDFNEGTLTLTHGTDYTFRKMPSSSKGHGAFQLVLPVGQIKGKQTEYVVSYKDETLSFALPEE